jgi:hypothetical protein
MVTGTCSTLLALDPMSVIDDDEFAPRDVLQKTRAANVGVPEFALSWTRAVTRYDPPAKADSVAIDVAVFRSPPVIET